MGRVTIDMLHNVALLNVFDFYVDETEQIEAWHASVRQKWREVVLGSHIA